jgi:hypothetical protein
MDKEKYIIEGSSTQNFYKNHEKDWMYCTNVSRRNLKDLKKALLACSIAIGI